MKLYITTKKVDFLRISFFYLFYLFFFIFKLHKIVLVLPNIKMNLPQVYMCSPSWTLLPPPSHTIPLGCPSALAPSIQYRASNLDWKLISTSNSCQAICDSTLRALFNFLFFPIFSFLLSPVPKLHNFFKIEMNVFF